MYEIKINQLIELIYEAAITPSKWTELLGSLADLVDYAENQSSSVNFEEDLLPIISNSGTKTSNISISETLKSIKNIQNDDARFHKPPEISEINELVMRHFSRAVQIAKRLVDIDEQHNVILSLLDRMPMALVLVDETGVVIDANSLADEMMASNLGIAIKLNHIDLGAENNCRLLDVIHEMSKHDSSTTRGQSLSITNEQTQNNIMIFVAPIKQTDINQKASVALFISERKSLPISLPNEFSEQYNLSKKELNVTEKLVRGLSIQEIAEETVVSAHTIRSHVKSVMHKTQTSRQAELVSLVYNGLSSFPDVPSSNTHKTGWLNKSDVRHTNYNVLQLSDGRNLAYSEYGDLNGEPVFHCHSIFGSRLELALDADKISKQKNVRLIVLDRPGYGASDPYPKTSFTIWSKDLVQLADYLKIEKFSLTGYVMGGNYALACAHELPERVKRVASISHGMMPESLSDYKRFVPFYRMNIRLAKYMPKAYWLISSILIKGALNDTDSFVKQVGENLSQTDRSLMESKSFKAEFVTSLKEAFLQGGKACSQEMVEFTHDCSFPLSNINVPVDIWHGSKDNNQPQVLSERFAEHIKDTRIHIVEGHGHYMFFTHWAEILDKLIK